MRNTSLYVVDPEGSRTARELVEAFTASGYFRVVGGSDRPADLVSVLEHGDAIAGLVLPVGFERDLAAGTARVQLLFDGTNSNTATIAKGYAERIVQRFALDRAGVTRAPAIDLRLSAWYNPDLDSRNYNVPAVIGLLLMLISLLLTSLAVVREREIGTLDQLLVSPLGAFELLLGKTIPFALVGVADLVLVTSVALLWFGVPLRGSVWLLLGATLLFLLCGLGLGLLVSTVSKTQQEAFLSSFLIFIPTDPALRVHVPGLQHAPLLPLADARQPDAPLPRVRARHLPARRHGGRSRAAARRARATGSAAVRDRRRPLRPPRALRAPRAAPPPARGRRRR